MSVWSAGYVADIGYTYGYYSELNPARIKLAFLNAGLHYPEVGHACELGFGQGVSINMHATAGTASWHGTDFNPAQAGFAQQLASASGAPAGLYDQSFEEFCQREDLPDFDYIGLHGIWSWISDENRAIIVDFLRRKLKVGGVLYVSYNTQPGWAQMVPVRDLMTRHHAIMGAPGKPMAGRIDESLDFIAKLFAADPAFARANPQAVERFNGLKSQNRNYLAHEYFNRDWHPMTVGKMAEWLAPAKVDFACSAHYLDHFDVVNLSAQQRALLAEISDPILRESVRDFMVNQMFRRDYWVRGARKMDPITQAAQLRGHRVLLTTPRADVSLKIQTGATSVTLHSDIYEPILDALATHTPKSLAEVEAACGLPFGQVVQAVVILAGAGVVESVQDALAAERAATGTRRLNRHFCELAKAVSEVNHLVSPVTGGGVSVNRILQLMLLARTHGQEAPAQWAAYAGAVLQSQGQRVLRDGVPVTTEAEMEAELTKYAQLLNDKLLPVYAALGIAL